MNSRPPSPLGLDHAERLTQFIQDLSVDREAVASELDVLCSIYGQNAIRLWPRNDRSPSSDSLRYEIDTNLPLHEDIHVQILVSLSSSYPSSSPPQLQLLSRYIGAFSVDRELFTNVLKTFISQRSGVEFTSETVAVFDGLQHVLELCSTWYGQRLSEEAAGDLIREEERSHRAGSSDVHRLDAPIVEEQVSLPAAVLEGVELIEAEPIIDRKSMFIGRACRITHPSQVASILSYLMTDRRVARAAHPVINAWRCKVDGVTHQDNDDDGETAAGGRLAHLLQILDLDGVLVIVTRFFGGIHLGPDRFKHINQAARSALEKGHFLDAEGTTKANSRSRKRH
ncbi:ribosomal protein S5 domain 2-type protein [Gautieria morchelliformis]|nr:ribosomal protein S5 domain 2-type protein [Gautieria morchelliformis]